uniref:Uncharacterized protein n=1 Tax=Tanacetum cinerariifolium TaxID=118510 RepID=A0A699HJ45_TANCI|nr:hypothetical protein [Tanacetum cinerariifolium]
MLHNQTLGKLGSVGFFSAMCLAVYALHEMFFVQESGCWERPGYLRKMMMILWQLSILMRTAGSSQRQFSTSFKDPMLDGQIRSLQQHLSIAFKDSTLDAQIVWETKSENKGCA